MNLKQNTEPVQSSAKNHSDDGEKTSSREAFHRNSSPKGKMIPMYQQPVGSE
jgi:hypothetical protein